MQVSVVQSSASTQPTSVSPPPHPPHTHFMLAGKRAGVNEKSLCMGEPLPNFFSSVLSLVIFQFSKHVHHE